MPTPTPPDFYTEARAILADLKRLRQRIAALRCATEDGDLATEDAADELNAVRQSLEMAITAEVPPDRLREAAAAGEGRFNPWFQTFHVYMEAL